MNNHYFMSSWKTTSIPHPSFLVTSEHKRFNLGVCDSRMELIEALEQLTLEVRNYASSNSSLPNKIAQSTDFRNITWQYPDVGNKNHPTSDDLRHNQLAEFGTSIDTLLAQITDLEAIEPPNVASRRKRFMYPKSILNDHQDCSSAGSMETSQEEDSDCSSQQSSSFGVNNNNNQQQQQQSTRRNVNPLVRDLLRRDLSAITDTVRKISQILALGKEIETIYKNNFSPNTSDEQSNSFKPLGATYLNLPYTRSLCEAFINLSSNEPHIRDLPTITRYISFCDKLMIQVTNMLNLHSTSTAKFVHNSNIYHHFDLEKEEEKEEGFEVDCDVMMRPRELDEIEMSSVRPNQDNLISSSSSYDEDDNDNDISCSFDRRQLVLGTWTENKLYIDHQSNN